MSIIPSLLSSSSPISSSSASTWCAPPPSCTGPNKPAFTAAAAAICPCTSASGSIMAGVIPLAWFSSRLIPGSSFGMSGYGDDSGLTNCSGCSFYSSLLNSNGSLLRLQKVSLALALSLFAILFTFLITDFGIGISSHLLRCNFLPVLRRMNL